MLKAIFYARFHPDRGPSIIHQYPKDAIITPVGETDGLLDFSQISAYIIPSYELCGRALSICCNGHRVLGYPVSLQDEKYERNRFTFNVCIVLDQVEDPKPWHRIVAKSAAFFSSLEEDHGLLQTEELLEGLRWAGEEGYPIDGAGVVYQLLKSIFTELNAYGETCIRVTDLHVLNLRLEPGGSSPPNVNAWDVPLVIRSIAEDDSWTWDLTLQRIHPHVNGLNHVQRISEVADVELELVEKAVGELVLAERVMLLDVFHFQAIYALTSDYALFVGNVEAQEECLKYVVVSENGSQRSSHDLVTLYRNFGPGLSVREFCITQATALKGMDIRRLVTYAVIKGFLRRIHKFVLSLETSTATGSEAEADLSPTKSNTLGTSNNSRDRAWKKAAFSSGWTTPPLEPSQAGATKEAGETRRAPEQDQLLRGFLDGTHCMDEICETLHMSEKQVLERLRSGVGGDYILINK